VAQPITVTQPIVEVDSGSQGELATTKATVTGWARRAWPIPFCRGKDASRVSAHR
jgi:hypothetical protein